MGTSTSDVHLLRKTGLRIPEVETRVANPVEKSCTQGSFVIEGKSKGES
jgi:hypothetical protein